MFDLRLFDAAAVQKTSTNNNGNSLAYEIKEYYERKLLKNAEPALIHDQCGEKYTIPKGSGHTIEWRKFSSLPKATTALTEAVTPDGDVLNVVRVQGTVYQYGSFIRTSDRLELEAFDPIISETSELQGAQAGATLNTITRDVLAGATNKCWPNGKSARSSLASTDTISLKDIFNMVAIMRANNVPTIDGSNYVVFIHPYIANDLMMANLTSHGSWIDVTKYSNAEQIFKGELGQIGGARFVQSSECKIWKDSNGPVKTAATQSADAVYYSVFQTLMVGKGGYAVTELAGGGLEYIVKPLGYGEDPLNQRASMGWKAMKGATILDQTRLLSLETVCATKDEAPAN